MKKEKIKLIPVVLALTVSASGCTNIKDVYAKTNSQNNTENGSISPIIEVIESKTIDGNLAFDVPQEIIEDKKLSEVFIAPYEYPAELQVEAAVKNLQKYGLKVTDVTDELENILIYSQCPRCSSIEEMLAIIPNLFMTCNYCCNPFASYLELAKLEHQKWCELEHKENFFGAWSCDELIIKYNSNINIGYFTYYDQMYENNKAYLKIKQYLNEHPHVNFDTILYELEDLFELAINPNKDECNNFKFSNLKTTLKEGENLFYTYLEFAVEMHNARLPFDAYEINDGIVNKKLILTN